MEQYKRHLVNKREAVHKSIKEYGDVMPYEHLRYKLHDLLPAISAALDRVELGTYGVCVTCGEPIDARRLARLPESSRCVFCATRYEVQYNVKK